MRAGFTAPPLGLRARGLLASALVAGLAACADPRDGEPVQRLAPILHIETGRFDFGSVPIGGRGTRTALIENRGHALLEVAPVTRGAPLSPPFDTDLRRRSIRPGHIGSVTLGFSPLDLGPAESALVFTTNDPERPEVEFTVHGVGRQASLLVTPETLAFGSVVVGTRRTASLHLDNQTGVDRRVAFDLREDLPRCADALPSAAFCVRLRDRAVDDEGRFTMPPGASATIEVEFRPESETRFQTGFAVRACEHPACVTDVRLDGLGLARGFVCEPRALDFGAVNPGACVSRPLSCRNLAFPRLTVIGSTIAHPGSFELEASSPRVLRPGDAVDIEVGYCPRSLDPAQTELRIETDQAPPHDALTVGLRGRGGGPDIEVLTPHCDFGLASLIAPLRCEVVLQNTGIDALLISEIDADTRGTGAFRLADPALPVLEPGARHRVSVVFQPWREGLTQSSLRIRSNDQDEPTLDVPLRGEGVNLPPCVFEVSPATLDFAEVPAPQRLRRAVAVRNTSAHRCLLTSVALDAGTSPEFSLPSVRDRAQIISAGATHTIEVDFAPQAAGPHRGGLVFSISSVTEPFQRVALSGDGVERGPLVAPRATDFGAVQVGCRAPERTLRIYNPASVPALVDTIAIEPSTASPFALALSVELPHRLPAGGSADLAVAFVPARASAHAAAVQVAGSFEGRRFRQVVSLLGAAASDPWQEDRIRQGGNAKVDVLFVLDFSGSMATEQAALAENIGALLQLPTRHGIDYQIGLTAHEYLFTEGRLLHPDRIRGNPFGGPYGQRIITSRTRPDPESVLARAVQGQNLYGGASPNGGFYTTFLALTAPTGASHNRGFLRPDAALSIIFVSDEPEQSSLHEGAVSEDPRFYADLLHSLKGAEGLSRVSASSIVAEPRFDTGFAPYRYCDGSGGRASIGPRYQALAEATGGALFSICNDDWPQLLETLASLAFGLRTRFFLTSTPVVDTLQVLVDGAPIPRRSPSQALQWTYDFASNAVDFTGYASPESGAEVTLRYRPASDCN